MIPANDSSGLPIEFPNQIHPDEPRASFNPEVQRLQEALQKALLKVSTLAREAGFYQGLLEGTLLMLDSGGQLDQETIDHIREKLREASEQAAE